LMALFRAPRAFAAGAAPRPVTDWGHYKHPYTATMLNTPPGDPMAYARSSPIEAAANYRNTPRLICHAMRAAKVFRRACVRPVTDWVHYNHPYTANILNTPLVDPMAYEKSSPIEYADNYRNTPMLIAHGMQDDNVFFKDSVRLVMRLIELKKENFEIAPYPLDPHGFVHPESWQDEYRRIFKLFENELKQQELERMYAHVFRPRRKAGFFCA